MKKFLPFSFVLALALMNPISASADTATAEVTAVRYGDESPDTSDSGILNDLMLMTAAGTVMTVICLKERRKRNEETA